MYVIPAETFGLFYREFRGCAGRSGLSFKCLSSYPDPVKTKCTASPLRSFLDSPVTSSLLGPNKTDHRDDIYYFVDGGILFRTVKVCGPRSSVGIATELRAGWSGIESRWRRDFPHVQSGPGAHPASCKMGTGSFPGVKCGLGVLLTTHPVLVPRSWKSRAIPTHPLGHTGPVTGSLYLYYFITALVLVAAVRHIS